ncbi:MAG: hypothetical protein EBZ67_03465, partial [Chitinophagia bacterium]|nr:hypothetical protein [Chitinophagia bacterium]
MIRKRIPFFCILLSIASISQAQQDLRFDTVMVESRAWYRDSLRNIRYTDWKSYPSAMLQTSPEDARQHPDRICPYGGELTRKTTSSGYFRALKKNGRWMLVDPHGHPF